MNETGTKKRVRLGHAVVDFLKRYGQFKGQTTRAGYWWVHLVLGALMVGIVWGMIFFWDRGLNDYYDGMTVTGMVVVTFVCVLCLVLIVPIYALAIRRYRDAGLRGRGVVVLMIISASIGSTFGFLEGNAQTLSEYDEYGAELIMAMQTQSTGGVLLLFVAYIISLSLMVTTVIPTDGLTTTSNQRVLRFFLRGRE